MGLVIQIVAKYGNNYDATLLINYLIGPLILLREALLKVIPATPFESPHEWVSQSISIMNHGVCDYGQQHDISLRQLGRRMLNAVAHFQVESFQKKGEVAGLTLKCQNGFCSDLTLSELIQFVVEL